MNFMVTTNQKPIIDTQKIKRKEYKHNSRESHQLTRGRAKEERNGEELQKQSENNRIAISTYL